MAHFSLSVIQLINGSLNPALFSSPKEDYYFNFIIIIITVFIIVAITVIFMGVKNFPVFQHSIWKQKAPHLLFYFGITVKAGLKT